MVVVGDREAESVMVVGIGGGKADDVCIKVRRLGEGPAYEEREQAWTRNRQDQAR